MKQQEKMNGNDEWIVVIVGKGDHSGGTSTNNNNNNSSMIEIITKELQTYQPKIECKVCDGQNGLLMIKVSDIEKWRNKNV